MIRCFVLISLMLCGLVSKAQQKEDFFYKDYGLTKEVAEKKAKYKKTVGRSTEGVVTTQTIEIVTNCTLREEYYKDNIPVGEWITKSDNCIIKQKRDFSSLTYSDKKPDTLYNNKIQEPNTENFEKAQFGESESAIYKYIARELRYPMEALESNASGKVYLQFIIKADGTIKMLSVFKSANPYLDYESWKLIEQMPKWHPAKKNGQAIDSYYRLPIMFSLK